MKAEPTKDEICGVCDCKITSHYLRDEKYYCSPLGDVEFKIKSPSPSEETAILRREGERSETELIAEFFKDIENDDRAKDITVLIGYSWKAIIEQAARNLFAKAEDLAFDKLIKALMEKTVTVDVIYHQTMLENFKKELKKTEQKTASAIFEVFDKYSCIKNDSWYLDLKKKHLSEAKH